MWSNAAAAVTCGKIKHFDQCCAIDVWPSFHGNLDFSPRFSFIFAEACTFKINKIIILFQNEQVIQAIVRICVGRHRAEKWQHFYWLGQTGSDRGVSWDSGCKF